MLLSRFLVLFAGVGILTLSCTDVIDVTLEPAEDRLVVDAWLNNKEEPQTIRLTLSQPYFDNVFARTVSNASVFLVRSGGDTLTFNAQGDGNYVWTPASGESIGEIGSTYELHVVWDGEHYISESELKRVPQIDSIEIELRTGELGFADGHYAAVYARDIPGIGDTYWIKAYKNGVFLNKPQEINLAYDASFDAGGDIDGIVFISPIRELINRFPDPDTPDDFDVPPYQVGDEIHVEIHSITQEGFFFMETARDQMVNGDNTIFAIPLANTRSNVIRQSDQKSALGFFCVSAVSEATRVVQ
jgi:hypothetical protein